MLVSVLEQLKAETTQLLECSEVTPEDWQAYAEKRARLFERLSEIDFSTTKSEAETVAGLMRIILDEETQVRSRLESSIDAIRQQLSSLSTARHALHGYASHQPAAVFVRCV